MTIFSSDPAPQQMVPSLWRHFRGFVEHDPGTGQNFSKQRDTMQLALDYALGVCDGVRSTAPMHRVIYGGSVIDPDRLGDYRLRQIRRLSKVLSGRYRSK